MRSLYRYLGGVALHFDVNPSSDDAGPLAHHVVSLPDARQLDALEHVLTALGATPYRYRVADAMSGCRTVERWLAELVEGEYDDVIFATAQGVHLLCEFAAGMGKERELLSALGSVRVMAVGPKPARALADLGVSVAIRIASRSAESLIKALEPLDLEGHIVGLQYWGPELDPRISEHLENCGAKPRLVSNAPASDQSADEVMMRLCAPGAHVIVFTNVSQVTWLFEAVSAAGRSRELLELLLAARVVATESVSDALQARGVRVTVVSARSLVVAPQVAEVRATFSAPRAVHSTHPTAGVEASRNQQSTRQSMGKKRVVVIGNGMVGYKFCEKLLEHDRGQQYQLVTFCEEPRPAYDRMNLTKYFEARDPDVLSMAPATWYSENGVELLLGQRAVKLDRRRKVVIASDGSEVPYDLAVLATGSAPFVPPVPGMDKMGVFVYRTIEDLEAILAYASRCRRAAVLGGGLLGLEAAKAVHDLNLNAFVVEFAPRLMPRQLDQAGSALLARKIEELGLKVMTGCNTTRVLGDDTVTGIRFADGERLDVDMLVVSAGIRPRDELARDAGMRVGERGGIVIDDQLRTSDPDVYAIGECALHRGMIYGLLAPGNDMADVLARNLCGERRVFTGADMSTKLKLLGVDVASFGDALVKTERSIVYEDLLKGVYKKLVLSDDGTRLLGGSLVGEANEYGQLLHLCKTASPLPKTPENLILGARGGSEFQMELPDEMQVCSCNNVSKGEICNAIAAQSLGSVGEVKRCTKAGSGCGGCLPLVTDIFNAQLKKAGKVVKAILCEHLNFTRQELYQLVRVKRYTTFEQVLAAHGSGNGCEVCKPTIASILASVNNELIVNHDYIQDTNDRFLANIQRQGLYSVVPRVPGGEITADQLITLGQVAKKYNLYSKITGGQRVDLFGARVGDLPDIWKDLGAAGFESGHAYGKSLRTVKSCVGSTWCRYGVQDSVGMAIRLEHRYKGIRSPHKLKSAVSGCVRECAEAQSKDFALIATEKGYNVYVCGNGGAKPRHADLLIADVSEQDAIRYLDRFIMFYIRTADRLTRTSVWLEKLEGGIEHLRDVILKDKLGICEQLEAELQHLVDTYQCEWKSVVDNPALQAKFRHFANSEQADSSVELVDERGSRRPSDWSKDDTQKPRITLPIVRTSWIQVGRVADFPKDAGMAVQYGAAQIAVFNFTARGEWFAVQNECPHKKDMVLARGLIGDETGTPKVACPLHKKTFSLVDGTCLSGEDYHLERFPVRVQDGLVYVELPPVEQVEKLLAPSRLVRAQGLQPAACPPSPVAQMYPAE